jgi:hypothetical protein
MVFSEIFTSISVLNRPFWRHFCMFQEAWKAYLTSLTPSTTTPWLGTPQRTKQFLSHPHGLYLFLSEHAEMPTTAEA